MIILIFKLYEIMSWKLSFFFLEPIDAIVRIWVGWMGQKIDSVQIYYRYV